NDTHVEKRFVKSVTPTPTRKSNIKQRIRRFNSSIENRIFNIKQPNDTNYSHKSTSINKVQVKNQELIDEAKQLNENETLDKQTTEKETKSFLTPQLHSKFSNVCKNRKSMNNLYDTNSRATTENLGLKPNSLNKTNISDVNKIANNNSANLIDNNELFKKASYESKPIAKDAIKTSLKTVNKDKIESDVINVLAINTNTEPVTTSMTKTINSNENSDITTTTTITTTKTIVKLNDKRKSLSKRRNTISSITLINNSKANTTQAPNDTMVQTFSDKKMNKVMANEIMEISETSIFDIIEREVTELLRKKLIVTPQCINSINEYDLTPLDMALMLNNKEMITLLLKNGAIENPTLSDWNDRYDRICSRLSDLDSNLRNFLEEFDVSALDHEKIEEYDLILKDLDFKMRLTRRMKYFYENINYPGEVKNIALEINSPTSLMVRFEEPDNSEDVFIIKYLIEWSSSSTFEPLDGQIVLSFVDTSRKEYIISNLVMFKVYYVRVSCANIKGYGTYSLSDPSFGIPSYWRDGEFVQNKLSIQRKKLVDLDNEINLSKSNLEFVNPTLLNQLQKFSKSKKTTGLKRNLKTIFTLALATTSLNSSSYSSVNVNSLKFAKQIKKCSAYLVCVMHDGDKILTTLEDTFPMIEIDENYSFQNINSDFQFLVKLSFNWTDIDNFKTQIEQSITTSSLRFKYLTLCVIKQMQNLLEVNDLGRVYHNYIKNGSNGSVFFILVKKITTSLNQNLVKLNPIEKLLDKNTNFSNKEINDIKNSSINSNNFNKNNEDTAFLLKYLKLIIEYDINCNKKLSRGFYVAFLKLQSSIELIKVMVPFKIPNSLPCEKIRDNPNVSREEWNLLKSVKLDFDKLSINELNSIKCIKQILEAIDRLFKKFDICGDEMQNSRLITRELIEVNEDVTLLLICPTAEQTCIMQLTEDNNQLAPMKIHNDFEYIYLPVQLFEAVHLSAYDLEFIKNYVKISIKLELELFASNQFNREAFSNEEIEISKKILSLVGKYQRSLEDIWKESRWIINCINNARDKVNQQTQISISDIKNFLDKFTKEKSKKKHCKCNNFDLNNNNINKKNIYNHITQLPQVCNCENQNKNNLKIILSSIGLKNNSFNHIDSVLVEDEDLENFDHMKNILENYGSIEDLRGKNCDLCDDCRKNCVNCQKNKSQSSLNSIEFYQNGFNLDKICENESGLKTVNKLVSKLYISAPTTPSTPKNLSTEDLTGSILSIDYKLLNPKLSQNSFTSSACSVYSNSTNPVIKEHLIESPLSTSSSSGYYSSKNDSNLPSPSFAPKTASWQCLNINGASKNSNSKQLNIIVDFDTGLKIDLNFECTINGQTTCKDLIYHMIKKINSFIYSFNQINKGYGDGFTSDMNGNLISLVNDLDFKSSKRKSSIGSKEFGLIPSLDENLNLYFLVICLRNSFANEKILSNSYVLSNLKEPWSNGTFYLRNNPKVLPNNKRNLQQF
ncbi:unnamed protein product, partial [Brachionus calyciflorus]